jgi:hypothetical protein
MTNTSRRPLPKKQTTVSSEDLNYLFEAQRLLQLASVQVRQDTVRVVIQQFLKRLETHLNEE